MHSNWLFKLELKSSHISKNMPYLEQLHQLVHKFFHFAYLKSTFSILHTYFYKTPTSVCLFYTFIQIKYSFLYPHSHRPTATDPHRYHTGIHTTHWQQTQQTRKTNPATRSSHPESTQPNCWSLCLKIQFIGML